MDLENWKRVFDLVHSSREANEKDGLLLVIAEDVLLRANEREGVADFILDLLKRPAVELPDPTDRMYYATLVARHTPVDSPIFVNALSLVIQEARKDNSGLSEDDRRTKFRYFGDVIPLALEPDFRKRHLNLHQELFGLYLREALKVASFDTVAPIKDLTTLLAALPADTKDDVKTAISDTIVQITKNAAKGAASLLQSLPRGAVAGREAQAQA